MDKMMSKYMGQIMAECDCQHQACEMRGYCMTARIEELQAENKRLKSMIADVIHDTGDDPRIMAASRAEWAARALAAEAKLSKSEALLAKAVVNLRTYAPHLVDGPEHDVGYYHGYHTALDRILDFTTELKGQDDE